MDSVLFWIKLKSKGSFSLRELNNESGVESAVLTRISVESRWEEIAKIVKIYKSKMMLQDDGSEDIQYCESWYCCRWDSTNEQSH